MIKINNYHQSSYNRPDEGSDAARKILGILIANKCKKITDKQFIFDFDLGEKE